MMIGMLTSLTKFFNLKTKTEDIIKIREKVYNCNTKIFSFDKNLKSTLYLQSREYPEIKFPPDTTDVNNEVRKQSESSYQGDSE